MFNEITRIQRRANWRCLVFATACTLITCALFASLPIAYGAPNGDVATVNLAKDYRAELLVQEDIQDGERHLRHCYKLALTATMPDVTYHHIETWIDTTNNRPVKAKFYSESNQVLKSAYYRH